MEDIRLDGYGDGGMADWTDNLTVHDAPDYDPNNVSVLQNGFNRLF